MRLFLVAASILGLLFAAAGPAEAGGGGPCSGIVVTCPSPTADAGAGQYHGLIALTTDASLIQRAAHSGTEPGCGDCVWTVVEDCPNASPSNPGQQIGCYSATHDPHCRKHQYAERIFLSTKSTGFADEGVYCIGGQSRIVAVGDIALSDVDRYLKDVTPPDLVVSFDPGTSLAGLATKVFAAPPSSLKPQPFGGQGVTETITVAPAREQWTWGDGTSATFTPASSGEIRASHTYLAGGHDTAGVRTTWGATYTITYQGQTFGPYDATGTLTEQQSRAVTVATSTPVLVSHS